MAGAFITRSEKASWGIPCNQRADGDLFVGKGYKTSLADQIGAKEASAIKACLENHRGNRNGRFWVNLKAKTVTMMIGESSENTPQTEHYGNP